MATVRARARTRADRLREKQAAEARYDAAGMGRRISGWRPPTSGPNKAITGLQTIRDRARDSTRNDWAGEAGIQRWVTNLIGWGITPYWKEERHQELWDEWAKVCDADGVLNAYGLQALGVRAWLDGGEVFLRRRPRALVENSPLPLPLQVQLVEAEYVPLLDSDSWPGLPAGNEIRQGIERNKYGRRTAYWMYKEHPQDGLTGRAPREDELIRVPASEVRHLYELKRPGQLRGVSMLAPVLVKLRNSMDFEDAVLDRQKLANLFTLFITRELPPEWDDIDFDEQTGLPKFYNNDQPVAGLEPGISQELRPGEKPVFGNPPEAGTKYPEYMRSSHLGTSAGQHVPYELMSGDIMNVSDRTLRIVIQEFRRLAQQRQFQTIIPMLCQPMAEWFGQAAVLAGKAPASELKALQSPEWTPHGWEYIHPVQDVQGKIMARDGNLTSTSALIRERGDNPRKVAKEIKADRESGLTPEPVEPAAPGAPAGAPGKKKSPATTALEDGIATLVLAQARAAMPPPAPAPQPALDIQALVTSISAAFTAALAPALQAIVAQAQRPPAPVNVQTGETHVHVPEGPAPVVHVANDVHVPEGPAPVVNVSNEINPTPVQIVNQVQPAEVKVELPDRQTASEIERDLAGNIVKVVQTETTIQ